MNTDTRNPLCTLTKQGALHNSTPVENLFILEYMLKAPGDFVKVYLYALMQGHYPELAGGGEPDFARALGLEEKTVRDAMSYWQRQGIARLVGNDPSRYELERIYDTLLEGGAVKEIKLYQRAEFNSRVQELFGKRYFRDFDRVYDWIDVYGLPEDVVLYLLEYSVKQKGVSVRMNYIETIALDWANENIKSVEQAEAKLFSRALETTDARKVLRHIGIKRLPTVDEYELYQKWMGWGFTLETVLLAAKEMTRIQSPNFAYVDKVLERLKDKGATSQDKMLLMLAPKPAKQQGAHTRSAPDSFMKREYDKYNPEKRELLEDDPDEA